MSQEQEELGEAIHTGEFYTMSPQEKAARNQRSLFIALGIVGFMVLVYATFTIRAMDYLEKEKVNIAKQNEEIENLEPLKLPDAE